MEIVTTKESNVTNNIKPAYNLDIRGQWARKFMKIIDMINDKKMEKLEVLKPSQKYEKFKEQMMLFWMRFIEITKLSPKKYPKLYDVTVPSTINFAIANGLIVRDTAKIMWLTTDSGL